MEQTKIVALVGGNVATAAINPMVNEVGGLLVMLGQILVAAVTVWYIVKKIRMMKPVKGDPKIKK